MKKCVFLILLLHYCCGAQYSRDRNVSKPIRYISRLRNTDGPHVCIVEEVVDMDIRFHTPWTKGSFCGKESVFVYECCEGYDMLHGTLGCPLVLPLEDTLATVRTMGADIFADLATDSGLAKTLGPDQGVFTVLAPIDKALRSASPEELQFRVATVYGTGPALLFYHLINKNVRTDDLHGGEVVVPSLYNGRNIRFNTHYNGVVTANCVPLLRRNYQTKNGVVHTLSQILKPGIDHTIMDYLLNNQGFGKVATLLVQASLTNMLREKGPFTVFMPTDKAFSKLPSSFMQDVLYDEGTVKAVASYHIAKGVHCSAILTNRVLTLEGSPLTPDCTGTNRTIDGAKIIEADLMATNGFIHIIDKVLIPTRAKRIKQVLKEKGLNIFLRLLERVTPDPLHGLNHYTIFAPTDRAFKSLDNDTQFRLENDTSWLGEVVRGHISSKRISADSLLDLQKIDTLQPNRKLTVKLYRELILVDMAVLTRGDYDGRDGAVHVVDSVLIPPIHTVGEYLKTVENFTMFTTALNATDGKLLDVLGSGVGGPWTVMAVDNANIHNYAADATTYWRMLHEPRILNRMLSNHIIEDLVVIRGLRLQNYYKFQDYKYEPVLVHREGANVTTVGIANVERPDILCTNGIVHIVDRVMQRFY